MNKKSVFALVCALLLTLALFTGCGGAKEDAVNQNAPKTSPESNTLESSTPQSSAPVSNTDEPQAEVEASPYNLAAGKFTVDNDGFPHEAYTYELPLSTTDEVFTWWTCSYSPQYLPEEGYMGLGMYKGMKEMTGVNIEYVLVASPARAENFSVLVNADSLHDIISQATSFWTAGTPQDAIEEGYLANIYDYKDYMPNYLYQVYSHSQQSELVKGSVFYAKDIWVAMCGFYQTPILNTGYMIRQDILDDLGLGKASDIKTYSQFHEILKAMKTSKGDDFWPMMMYSTFEMVPLNWCGYNTTPYNRTLNYQRVVDGKVQFCGTTQDDLELMKLLNSWWNEKLIDPNWSSYTDNTNPAFKSAIANDLLGSIISTPSNIPPLEKSCINTDCMFAPTPRLRITENQIIKWGYSGGHITYGSASFSAKCKNLPLVVSLIDWKFSQEGAEWTNWGPEGEVWEYNDKGERQLTEFALTHPAGTSWLQNLYCNNELVDPGIQIWRRNYAFPGGDRFIAMFDVWDASSYYDGSYVWPTGIKFTTEQRDIIKANSTDANTYFQENSVLFFYGDTPFSEWNSYVKQIMDMGLTNVIEVYQQAYDEYIKQS